MSFTRRHMAALLVQAVLLLAAAPAALAGTPSGARIVGHSAACVYARIDGERKCLRSGSFCSRAPSAQRVYRRNDFRCTRSTSDGKWRLRRR